MEPLRRHASPGQHAAGLPGTMCLPQAARSPERDAARPGIRLALQLCRHRTHAAERLQNARMQRRERSPVSRRVHELGARRPTSRLRCPNFLPRMRPQVLSRCLQARPTSDGADLLGLDGTPQTPQRSDALSLTSRWAVCARMSVSGKNGRCPTHCAAGRRRGAVSWAGAGARRVVREEFQRLAQHRCSSGSVSRLEDWKIVLVLYVVGPLSNCCTEVGISSRRSIEQRSLQHA